MTCDDEGHSYFASFPDDRVRWTRKPYYSSKFALADHTLAEVFTLPSCRLIYLKTGRPRWGPLRISVGRFAEFKLGREPPNRFGMRPWRPPEARRSQAFWYRYRPHS